MNRFISTDPNNLRIAQILDANLDRAREGLRVLEDWARFGIGKDELVKKTGSSSMLNMNASANTCDIAKAAAIAITIIDKAVTLEILFVVIV